MESLSKIANMALNEITAGTFIKLPFEAINGLLIDFQYSWLKRLDISYDFNTLEMARSLCSFSNHAIFRATRCKCTDDIRDIFSGYIDKFSKDDDRVILRFDFDGVKIDAIWVPLAEYQQKMGRKSQEGTLTTK